VSRLDLASHSLLSLEELAARDTLLTRLSPLAKLLSVLFYLAVTLSFPQAALSGLLGMALYPCLMYTDIGNPLGLVFQKRMMIEMWRKWDEKRYFLPLF